MNSGKEYSVRRDGALAPSEEGASSAGRPSRRRPRQSFFDRVLRGDNDLRIVAEYVFANPVMAGLVEEPGEYPLSGGSYFQGSAGQS